MTQKEKLVELIAEGRMCPVDGNPFEEEGCLQCKYAKDKDCDLTRLADYLLENGVIVPPCKVGDKFYYLGQIAVNGELKNNFKVFEEVVDSIEEFGTDLIIYDRRGISFGADCIFRTKEEAEKVLAEKRADNG